MPGYQAGMVIDDTNYHVLLDGDSKQDETLPDGTTVTVVEVNGHKRYLSRKPKPPGHDTGLYSVPYSSVLPVIPESEWKARIDEMKHPLVKRRVSDYQKFAPHDQNGLPSCWRNGTAHAATTLRVMQGMPGGDKTVYISACSLCPDISPHVGGYEGDSVKSLLDIGGASTDVWSNNDTNMSLTNTPAVQESRKHHKGLLAVQFNNMQEFASGLLLRLTGPIAYDWWSHVISSADIGYDGDGYWIDDRNNWGQWGAKNESGFWGYVRMRLSGKGIPDSGFFLLQMNQSTV